MSDRAPSESLQSIRRHLRVGVTLSVLLAGVFGTWAATAQLSGAVIAHGTLVVSSSVKKVQHPVGGVVGALNVREGDTVETGEVLVRLDPTQAQASLQIVVKQIDELLARQAREIAEQKGASEIAFPADLVSRAGDAEVDRIMNDEKRLFEIRSAAREGERLQLRQKIVEFQHEIEGLEEQITAKEEQLVLIERELVGIRVLLQKKLVSFTRVTALERDKSAIKGERGQFVTAVAGTKGRIAEAELQIIQIDHTMRAEVARELAEIRARLSEYAERRTAAQDQLSRSDIRAPNGGIVHQLQMHTIGGVIRAGETIMEIVPLGDQLVVEARIAPQDVNDVKVGQPAGLRFSGTNSRTIPEIDGSVVQVSADVTLEPRTGVSYYMVRIAVPTEQLARMDGVKPVPGMPVEVFVKTHDRTALAYLVQPMTDQISRAFREK